MAKIKGKMIEYAISLNKTWDEHRLLNLFRKETITVKAKQIPCPDDLEGFFCYAEVMVIIDGKTQLDERIHYARRKGEEEQLLEQVYVFSQTKKAKKWRRVLEHFCQSFPGFKFERVEVREKVS